MSVVLEYSVRDTIIICFSLAIVARPSGGAIAAIVAIAAIAFHVVMELAIVLSSVGKCGKSYSGVARHREWRGLCSGQQASVLGRNIDGRLFESITSRDMCAPTSGTIHSLIAPVPVGASVGTVHGGGLRGGEHRDKTVEETRSEGDDGHWDDLITQVRLSLCVLGGLTLKQTEDKLSQSAI